MEHEVQLLSELQTKIRQNPVGSTEENEAYLSALDVAERVLCSRSSAISKEEKRYKDRVDAIDAAIITITGLLHFHQRVSAVTDPNYLADAYAIDLSTALDCLKAEKNRLFQND